MMQVQGAFKYNGLHTTQQVPNIKSYFENLLKNENFDVIIELGTSLGGLTYILDDIVKENNLKHNIHTFDIGYKDYVEKQLNERGCTYHILDERDEIYKTTVVDLMRNNNKVLLLCDGGNKKEEFNKYAPFLKSGDIIMVHDYAHDRNTFENEIKNKYWNWFEICFDDIKSAVELNNLMEYKKIDFKYSVWACYQKFNMCLPFAISTFCYGERYYQQTNRMIESFLYLEQKPEIFVVTDSPKSISSQDFVRVKNVNEYNQKYSTYNNDYYTFDFSVKRFSLLFALESGYNNVILSDADVVINESLYSVDSIMKTFSENSISGQVTYNFKEHVNTNSMLGRRLMKYEEVFNVEYNKELLTEMPEDCVQFIHIDDEKKYKFIETWDMCIKIKDTQGLPNVPAGNIDEMCFSALYNGMRCVNSSNKSVNLLIAKHDKWY